MLLTAAAALAARRTLQTPYELTGRSVLITGGSRGLGLALAREFAARGARLMLAARDGAELERAAADLRARGAQVQTAVADVTDAADVNRLVEETARVYGGLDVLVNNAAYQRYFHSFDEITLDEWEKTFATNVHAPFHLVRLALSHMPEGGSIINTASVNSKKPTPNILPYSATKGALANLTIGLAGLLAEKKIRVNAVLPGPIWTPFIPTGMDEESVRTFGEQTPFGRPGQPAELASAYVLLAADTSSYTSGTLLTISGGAVTL